VQKWDVSTIGSMFSNKGGRTTLSRVDSEENIIAPMTSHETPIELRSHDDQGITITHEVEVTYEPSNMPFVHAALVGLVHGEITNPKLVRR
jgi:hypothetical protein